MLFNRNGANYCGHIVVTVWFGLKRIGHAPTRVKSAATRLAPGGGSTSITVTDAMCFGAGSAIPAIWRSAAPKTIRCGCAR